MYFHVAKGYRSPYGASAFRLLALGCADQEAEVFLTITIQKVLKTRPASTVNAYHRYRTPIAPRCRPRFTRDIATDE